MKTEQQHGNADKAGKGPKAVTIVVNGQAVEIAKGEASGAEIKEAAIAQGVNIQPDFSLFFRGKDGLELIRDGETVKLKKGDDFTAVAPDDVS